MLPRKYMPKPANEGPDPSPDGLSAFPFRLYRLGLWRYALHGAERDPDCVSH
jgi:hypothetical protein